MGYTGITILSAYGMVTSVIIIILGVIITYDNCGEMVDVDDCKEITMGDGGKVTEIHNRLIKVDLLNSDQAEMGRVDSNGKSECPPCTFSTFTALEIVAITLLVVGIIANSRRLDQYVVKTLKKRSLRATEAKIKRDEEIKRKMGQELELERGMCAPQGSTADPKIFTQLVKDDGIVVANPAGWEEAHTK